MADVNISFSSPVVIDNNTAKFYAFDYFQKANWIVRDSSNIFYAGCTIDGSYHFKIFKSSDNGATWSDISYPYNSSDYNYGSLSLAISPIDDSLCIMYERYHVSGSYNAYIAEYDGSSWGSATAITSYTDGTTSAADYNCKFNSSGDLDICYLEVTSATTGILKHGRRLYGESSFTEYVIENTVNHQYYDATLAYSTFDNLLHIIYEDEKSAPGATYELYHRSFNGSTWSASTRLDSDSSKKKYHVLLYFNSKLEGLEVDDEGLICSWTEYSGYKVYFSKRNNSTWSSPSIIYTCTGYTSAPKSCTVDKNNRLYLALGDWNFNGDGNYNYNIASKYSDDGGTTWSATWEYSTDCNDVNAYQTFPFAVLPFDTADIVPVMYNIEIP
jgi:hypothetical protein